jgi:predicted Zn-dependent protease
MDITHQRLLVAAQGYSELDLPDLALSELDLIPAKHRHEPIVVETRLSVLMQAKRYQEALPLGRELCDLAPDRTVGFIHAAFCLHELGSTGAARDLLLSGPAALKAEATYYYNLACYEARLGNLDDARAHLDVSFAMDKKLRDYAHTDPDLAVLRGVSLTSS